MNPLIITAAISAALGFGGAWQIQSWRAGAKEAKHAETRLAEQRSAFTEFERSQAKVITAQVAAARRVSALVRDAGAARADLDSVRAASAEAVSAAAASLDACTGKVATFKVVFDHCAGAFVGMASDAQEWYIEAMKATGAQE